MSTKNKNTLNTSQCGLRWTQLTDWLAEGYGRGVCWPRPASWVLDTVYPNAFHGECEPSAVKIGTESKLALCGWSGQAYDGVDSSLLRPPQPHTSQLGTVYATKRRRRNGKR
ncbi:unnamed protein product [Pieris macdunnoughi]|uniref:Uncharacterized protein n=1 Tax=Pieris macdunnoughi TaxID=345717 RepID=A0A821RHJ0_9NEOP|nr:unnamed protein product [Pieris macdunnoughi]